MPPVAAEPLPCPPDPRDDGGAPTYARYRALRRFGALDGLRAVSIGAVLWHHADLRWSWLPLSGRGHLGVSLFFVLSGFLIVTLLLREREDRGRISLKAFYLRRALRIFPAYYALLAIYACLFGLARRGPTAEIFFRNLPCYLSYTSNWIEDPTLLSITWSLSTEEQFYALWPPIEALTGGAAGGVVAAALAALALLAGGPLGELLHGGDPAWSKLLGSIDTMFQPILAGVVLAHLLQRPATFDRIARVLGRRWSILLPVAALLVLIGLPGSLGPGRRVAVNACLAAILGAAVIREDHGLARLLSLRPLARIGAVSYGMYLFHMLARDLATRLLDRAGLLGPWPLLAVMTLLTLIAAELSFRFLEAPFLRLKTRYSRASA